MVFEARISRMVCPRCGGRLRRGIRRFGPAQVVCGHCGDTINTGLDDWSGYSLVRKVAAILGQIVWPSFYRGTSPAVSMVTFLFHWAMISTPLTGLFLLVSAALGRKVDVPEEVIPSFFIMAAYPLFFFIWLARTVREARRFSGTDSPPTWRISGE